MPGLVEFRNTRDDRELSVVLCVLHVTQAQAAVKEMETLRKLDAPEASDRPMLDWGQRE